MNEMGYTVNEYTDSYQTAIKRSETRNIARGKAVTLLTTPKKYAGEDPMTLAADAGVQVFTQTGLVSRGMI
ncbi:MAG: hypothetical protein R2744_05035 [Bacteroidales bacterium]